MVDADDGGLYEDLFGTEEDVEAEDDDEPSYHARSETAAELFQRLEASREEASLEALLFEDEIAADAGEALFQSEAVIPEQFPTAAETVESIATSNVGIEAIASLTDLMPILRRSEETHDPVDGTEQGLWEQAEALTADEFSEDTFIPASPDESLLPKEESLEEPDRDIDLSAAAMQQLRQDLSQMEEGTPHPTPIPRSTVSDRPQTAPAESVLEEWLAEEAGERPPSAEIPHGYIQPDPPRPVDTAALDAWFSTPSEAGYAEVASGDLFADLEASAQDYREQVQIPDIFVAASSPTSDPGSPDRELLAELEAATCYDYPEVDLDAFSLEESAEPDLAAIALPSPSQAVSQDEAFFFAGDGAAEADTVEDVVEADTVEADTTLDELAMDESAASATDADLFAADGFQSDPVAAESLAWEALEATPEAQADAFSLGDTEPAWTEDATPEAIQGFPPAEVNGLQDAAIAAELAEDI
ncbi:MAG: hypothetical protein HC925_06135 [Coleofasciculaceae cyanobacterium SM2_3_26]|nr:hypothetical protein [Coleofasciculaceae cyanobacterium SM2_3_26]